MHSLLSIYVLAKSAISECFIEIHESFPILSQLMIQNPLKLSGFCIIVVPRTTDASFYCKYKT